ncbi:MAG: hypothetical protein WCD07_12930 [Burkholderiales bacterium]
MLELPQLILLLTALFAGGLSLHVHQLNAYRTASAKFRAAVLTALEGLYPVPANWPMEAGRINIILREAFPALQIATAEFKPFVPWWRKRSFENAWYIYRLGKEGRAIDLQDYWQYIPTIGFGIENGIQVRNDNTATYKNDFKTNVDRLLSHAKSV